jgi:hypothetical protein
MIYTNNKKSVVDGSIIFNTGLWHQNTTFHFRQPAYFKMGHSYKHLLNLGVNFFQVAGFSSAKHLATVWTWPLAIY